MARVSALILALVAFVVIVANAGEPDAWYQLTVAGFRPPSREGAAYFTRTNGNIILWGGYEEQNAINLGDNIFYNDMFELVVQTNASCGRPNTPGCTPRTEFYTWYRIQNGTNAPAVRALFCWAYDAPHDRLYIFGGSNYSADFSSFTFYSDTWRFDFATNLWTQLFPKTSPPPQGGNECARVGGHMYMFGGAFLNPAVSYVSVSNSDLWKYHFAGNQWVFLGNQSIANASGIPWPGPRLQHNFVRIRDTDTIFLTDGFDENVFGTAQPYNDIWVYHPHSDRWIQKRNTNHPLVKREYMGCVSLSSRYMFFQGGDAQGNRTAADVCLPPLICFIAATPTDTTQVYDLQEQKWTELFLEREVPPLRRTMLTLTHQNLVLLFGGFNFDGANGVGALRDRNTYAIEPKSRYFRNIREDDEVE